MNAVGRVSGMRLVEMTEFFRASLVTLSMWAVIGSSHAQTGASMLRIDCSGSNAKTEVYVDDKFRGECPVDIQVQEGARLLRFYKSVDQRTEQVYEEVLKVGAGTIKRLEVNLPGVQLNAAGRQEEEQRKARERELEQEKIRQAELKLQEQIRQAEGGDMHAMYAMARRYASGDGVPIDPQKMRQWDERAAQTGHLISKLLLTQNFTKDEIDGVRKLAGVLGQAYVSGKFVITDEKKHSAPLTSAEILKPGFARDDVIVEFGSLMPTYQIGEDYGVFFNSKLFTVSLLKINYLIGDIFKPSTAQEGVFGYDIHEFYTNASSRLSVVMHKILLCANMPKMTESSSISPNSLQKVGQKPFSCFVRTASLDNKNLKYIPRTHFFTTRIDGGFFDNATYYGYSYHSAYK